MADTHETIADIRKETESRFRELVEAWMQRRSTFQTTVGAMQAFNNVFDRIEAAHKREAVTGSNQLREALKRLDEILYIGADGEVHGALGKASEIERNIKAALAAPATAEKSSAVGDAAKLREAIDKCVNLITEFGNAEIVKTPLDVIIDIEAILKDALAAPPRNCDRFATVDEARKAHEAVCEKYVKCHYGCPLNNEEHYSAFDCFEAWLFAPATEKEGGAK